MAMTGARLEEQVLLLNETGAIIGTAPKASVHHRETPLHLGFSCYVFGPDDRLLMTQRAETKPTWGGVWSNSCCGHPGVGETLAQSVERRLAAELGIVASKIVMLLPWFRYRATMPGGITEYELCPVVAARTESEPRPVPEEVRAFEWCTWSEFRDRALASPETLSPWSVAQVRELADAGLDQPAAWWERPEPDSGWVGLDDVLAVPPKDAA